MMRILALLAIAACTTEPPMEAPPDGGLDDAPIEAEAVTVIDLGTVNDGQTVTIAVPPNTLGMHLLAERDATSGTPYVGFDIVTDPNGQLVVDLFSPVGAPYPSVVSRRGVAALTLPMTDMDPTAPLAAGVWRVTVSIPSATARVRAYIRTTSDGAFHGGALDLTVYIPEGMTISDPTPAHTITAATAATDPCVAARIDSFFATLKTTFDLDRGAVEYVALPASYAAMDETTRTTVGALTTQTSPRAHVVLTNALVLAGNAVWGSSPGIPGSSATAGHSSAAVVVDVSLVANAVADGMTMVHELGHFVGLYHTTDFSGQRHDPLSDTPECTPEMTVCPDGHNIMFHGFYGASGGVGVTASAQQRRVVWATPLYRAAP